MPGLSCKLRVLKSLTCADLKKLYIATNNFLMSMYLLVINERKKSKDEELSDDKLEKLFSPKLRNLFKKNPNLADLITEEGSAKTINSVKELRTAVEVLNQGVKIFNEENKMSLTENEARYHLNFFEGKYKMNGEIADKEYPNLPKGSRIISVVSPIGFYLVLTKKGNQLKILSTIPYAE